MYQRILVAVDGSSTSDRALQEAIRLAKDQHAALHIVHVVDMVPLIWDMEYTDIEAIQRALRQAGRTIIDRARETAQSAGIEAEAQLAEIGTPGQRVAGRIVEAATAWPADLLVIGTHGRRGLDHLLLGSIAEGVARLAPMSVLLVRGA
ncbi:MAG TPA: universal stress protein [Acidiferrobacterales bacterium]|nr:universal stress protein [Acidiferrobacterales bacterium]